MHYHVWPYDQSHGHARKTIIITLQKEVQRGEDAQILCHDIVCLWIWIKAKLEEHFPGDVVQRHQKLFDDGCLRSKNVWFKVMRYCKWFSVLAGKHIMGLIGCQFSLANVVTGWLVAKINWQSKNTFGNDAFPENPVTYPWPTAMSLAVGHCPLASQFNHPTAHIFHSCEWCGPRKPRHKSNDLGESILGRQNKKKV